MLLNAIERIRIVNLCPQKGGYLALCIVRKLVDKLMLTPVEAATVGFEATGTGSKIDAVKGKELTSDIHITSNERKILLEHIDELDKAKQITIDHLDVIAKIKAEEEEKDK